LSLELGGNAPFIVFDDADLDAAVEGAIASRYRNSGQTCVCANRFLIQAGVYDSFADKLANAVAALRVGNGTEAGVQQGPLIDAPALAKVEELVSDAVGSGARLAAGGKRHPLGGTFFEPTILLGVTAGMRIANEEIFGPVAPLLRFETEADAIRIANSSEFGLAAYFFSRDLARVWRVADAIGAGMAGVNTGFDQHRRGAVRRCQAIRHGTRGLEVRHRRIRRYQVRLPGRPGLKDHSCARSWLPAIASSTGSAGPS
jgi:succinate-semialdehyde dehydrogenase/glutarate-semialdehyde dehydrogenase